MDCPFMILNYPMKNIILCYLIMFIKKTTRYIAYYNEYLQLHRINNPALILDDNLYYYQNNIKHNSNGPAIIWKNGDMEYYQNGKRHNSTGPAIIEFNNYEEYYLYGVKVEKEELNKDKTYLKLKYDV